MRPTREKLVPIREKNFDVVVAVFLRLSFVLAEFGLLWGGQPISALHLMKLSEG